MMILLTLHSVYSSLLLTLEVVVEVPRLVVVWSSMTVGRMGKITEATVPGLEEGGVDA